MESSAQIQRVKEYISEKESAKQSSISSSLKITPSRLNAIIGHLEREGFLEKRKAVQNGHQVNTVVLVKDKLNPFAYKTAMEGLPVEEVADGCVVVDRTVGTGKAMFESPCFFCTKLETCGDDNVINFYNCPKLNEFISKKL